MGPTAAVTAPPAPDPPDRAAIVDAAARELAARRHECPACGKICKTDQGLKVHQKLGCRRAPDKEPADSEAPRPQSPPAAPPAAVLEPVVLGHIVGGLFGMCATATGCDAVSLTDGQRKSVQEAIYPLYLKNRDHPIFKYMAETVALMTILDIAADKVVLYRRWKAAGAAPPPPAAPPASAPLHA